jgi:hypothetical protein
MAESRERSRRCAERHIIGLCANILPPPRVKNLFLISVAVIKGAYMSGRRQVFWRLSPDPLSSVYEASVASLSNLYVAMDTSLEPTALGCRSLKASEYGTDTLFGVSQSFRASSTRPIKIISRVHRYGSPRQLGSARSGRSIWRSICQPRRSAPLRNAGKPTPPAGSNLSSRWS